MEEDEEKTVEEAKELADAIPLEGGDEKVEIPEEYQELPRKKKVLKMMEDKQYDIADVLRTIRMTIRQGAIPDKSLMKRLQEEVDLLKKYRSIY